MTNQERWQYYESGTLQRAVAVELLDWAGYWSNTGVSGITNPITKMQTRAAVNMILTNLSNVIKIVSAIAITYSEIKDAVIPTEANIHSVVTNIMSFRLEWITNIYEEETVEE